MLIRKARFLAVLVAFMALPATPAWAVARDLQLNKPYRVEVVLHVARHPLLTDVFKNQLRRELRDSLQAGLGNLGQVKITDQHPLLQRIESEGLKKALDGAVDESEGKVHFVLVDYVEDEYEVQTRQVCGLTGLASPVVRSARTPDRQFVARTAALLVDRDFGLVGKVEKVDNHTAQVSFKGQGLGDSLDRWVKKGEVFAIAQIVAAGGKVQGNQVEGALLQAVEDPHDGGCRCKLWFRYDDPLANRPGVIGYRCIKLGTTRAPLRLRLVNERDLPHFDLRVSVSPYGFKDDDIKENVTPNPDGVVQTKYAYENVAFLRVFSGGKPFVQVPLQVFEDATVSLRVSISPGAEHLGDLEIRKKRWTGLVYESLLVQADLRKELNELSGKSLLEAALEKARTGLKGLQVDLDNRNKELTDLRTEAKTLPPRTPFSLAEGEQRLIELQKARTELQAYLTNVEAAVQRENDPKRKQALALAEQARLQEGQAEYREAIRLYDEALSLLDDMPEARKRRDNLKKILAPKNDLHRDAQTFINEKWTKLESAQALKEHMEEARQAFQTCRAEGDWATVQRFVLANVAHTGKLLEQQNKLRLQESEDDRKTNQLIIDVNTVLKELLEQAIAYLKKAKPED